MSNTVKTTDAPQPRQPKPPQYHHVQETWCAVHNDPGTYGLNTPVGVLVSTTDGALVHIPNIHLAKFTDEYRTNVYAFVPGVSPEHNENWKLAEAYQREVAQARHRVPVLT